MSIQQRLRPNPPGLHDDDFYWTTEGFIVFTEAYHRQRGYCCKSGCRHCPYGFKKKDTDSLQITK